jgi:hypothetical protein
MVNTDSRNHESLLIKHLLKRKNYVKLNQSNRQHHMGNPMCHMVKPNMPQNLARNQKWAEAQALYKN